MGNELYGSIEAARQAGISLRQLYHWVDTLGVVRPKLWSHGIREFRRFSRQDVEKLKNVRFLVDNGYTLQSAVQRIKASGEIEGRKDG